MSIHLPTLNACLNMSAGILLFLGFRAIKSGKRNLHRNFMIMALIASTLFLCSYLYHHSIAGTTRYTGEGILRVIYFTILLTHTPLATIIVPFCIAAVYFAIKGQFDQHVKITRWLYPCWMYVSVTGVIIYLMLYVFS